MFIGFRIRLKDLLWLIPAVTFVLSTLLVTYPQLWKLFNHLIPL